MEMTKVLVDRGGSFGEMGRSAEVEPRVLSTGPVGVFS